MITDLYTHTWHPSATHLQHTFTQRNGYSQHTHIPHLQVFPRVSTPHTPFLYIVYCKSARVLSANTALACNHSVVTDSLTLCSLLYYFYFLFAARRYFARLGTDAISVYEAPGCDMVDNKSIKIQGMLFFLSYSTYIHACTPSLCAPHFFLLIYTLFITASPTNTHVASYCLHSPKYLFFCCFFLFFFTFNHLGVFANDETFSGFRQNPFCLLSLL